VTKPKPKCLGCGGRTGKVKKKSLPICPACRADRNIVDGIRYRLAWQRHQERIEEDAERETKNLPREDSYIPLTGEALVLKMQRGEW
jgi:hypothetical protein